MIRPPAYSCDWSSVYVTDALEGAKLLEHQSVHCIVTSPPYWRLRSYLPTDDPSKALELGGEPTPELYVERLVEVFRALWDVLRDDGTLWLNLGSSYAAGGNGGGGSYMTERREAAWQQRSDLNGWRPAPPGFKAKDLIPIPWLVGLALQRNGWYLRADNIWSKPNPMPSSVTDRPTISHEYMLLFSKKPRYFFDQEAVRLAPAPHNKAAQGRAQYVPPMGVHRPVKGTSVSELRYYDEVKGANIRSVWTIATRPYPGSHYATFPPDLIYPCVKAGSPVGGTVLDPFMGSGTTAYAARKLCRRSVGFDLDERNIELVAQRMAKAEEEIRYPAGKPKPRPQSEYQEKLDLFGEETA